MSAIAIDRKPLSATPIIEPSVQKKPNFRCRLFEVQKPWGKKYLAAVWDSVCAPFDDADLPSGVPVNTFEGNDRQSIIQDQKKFSKERGQTVYSWNLRNTL